MLIRLLLSILTLEAGQIKGETVKAFLARSLNRKLSKSDHEISNSVSSIETNNTSYVLPLPSPLHTNSTNFTTELSISSFNYTDNSELLLPDLQKLLLTGNYSDVFADLPPDLIEPEDENRSSTTDTASAISQLSADQQQSVISAPLQDSFLYISQPEQHTENNCYIVKIRESAEKATFDKLTEIFGALQGKIHKKYKTGFKGYTICFPTNVLPLTIMREIPLIEFIERDRRVRSSQIQEQAPWGLARLSSPDMNSQSFGFDATGEGVSVYVIDSGLEATKELGGRAKLGYSAFPDQPADCSGHGTEVASVIAGLNVGVAKKASVIVAQVLDCAGDGANSDLIDAISWVIATHQKPAVINMSLGGDRSPSVDKAVKSAIDAGITVIVAAGNANIDACAQSPAGVAQAITVAASSQANSKAKFSNYGPCVDIFAPGVNILTAATLSKSRNGWNFASGTSFAAPFVTGVAALLLEKNPDLTPEKLFSQIKSISAQSVIVDGTLRGSPNLLLQAPVAKSKTPILVDLTDPNALPALGYHTSSIVSTELILVIVAFVFAFLALVATGVAVYRRYLKRRAQTEPSISENELKSSILNAHRPSVFL
jgi:hypothetical protein